MRALLIDDERLARVELRRLLKNHPEVEIIGEAQNAEDALQQIRRLEPDVLFLDIQMPGRNGFQLLEELDEVPAVIFTTAHDEFALKAFEVSALDYLVKPIVPARLAAAIARLSARAAPTPSVAEPRASMPRQIFVREGDRCWFVPLKEIILLESEGNYTRLFFGPNRPLLLRSLNYLEAHLDPDIFFRASRKHIVNVAAIEAMDPWINGGFRLGLRGGHEVEMSRRQARKFQERTQL
jgi:two-component system, LytTR family, response regulator